MQKGSLGGWRMDRVTIFDVRIDCLGMEDALRVALETGERPCTVVTPNAVMLEDCRRDRHHAALLGRATLSLADGRGVIMAARRKGTPLPARVSGIDFGERLLAYAAEHGLRVFLLGGADGVAHRAGEALCRRYPGLCVCGSFWGYGSKSGEENAQLLGWIRQSRADILLVCFGYPLQEEWIFENLSALSDVRIIAGLGGSLDVWAGDVRRAPRLMQKTGLEWAWRMARQPARIKQLPTLLRFATHRKGTY